MGDTTQRWPRGEGNFYPAVREAPRPRPMVDAWPTTPPRDNQPGFDLADTLNALRRRLPTLMATAVIIGLLFAARAARQPATYSAEAEILMGRSVADLVENTPSAGSTTAERSLQNERRILLGSKITAAATAQLGAPPQLDVTAVAGSDVLRVTVTAATPEAAARGANAVVEAYVKDREAQFNDAIAATRARLASLVPVEIGRAHV